MRSVAARSLALWAVAIGPAWALSPSAREWRPALPHARPPVAWSPAALASLAQGALALAVGETTPREAAFLGFASAEKARGAELAGAPILRVSVYGVDLAGSPPQDPTPQDATRWVLSAWPELLRRARTLSFPVKAGDTNERWFLVFERRDAGWAYRSFGSASTATGVTTERDALVARKGLDPAAIVLVDVEALGVSVLAWRTADAVGFVSLESGDNWGKELDARAFISLLRDAAKVPRDGRPG